LIDANHMNVAMLRSFEVNRLARTGDAHIVDCGALKWIDVDDAIYLAKAEAWLAASGQVAEA